MRDYLILVELHDSNGNVMAAIHELVTNAKTEEDAVTTACRQVWYRHGGEAGPFRSDEIVGRVHATLPH